MSTSPKPSRPSAVSRRNTVIVDEKDGTPSEGYRPVFGRASFIWIGIGIVLMIVGMLLMSGGGMPSPDVWDDSLIYSFRRITLAPIVILAGLGVITYAIFKK